MSREAGPGQDGVPRLGAMLGRYRLDAVIGRGGMGVVFRAVDERLDRTVALKVLAPDLADDPQVQERFLREARLAAAIEHPHIVPVYEAASVGDVDYIAMRFVPGSDLGRVLRREGPLAIGRTLAIGEQVADALDAAHARGLIHRDVKPSNVLLEGRDTEWAWLTDFGLTKRIGGSMPPTREGLVGTLEYLSPEAIQHGTVDGRSDQYALACVVYHCLSGAPPFASDSEAQVLRAHLHDEPAPLDRPEGVEGDPDAVIRRALAKDPADRYPSCREFVADLRRAAHDVRASEGETRAAVAMSSKPAHDPPAGALQRPKAPAGRRGPALLVSRGRVLVALVVTGVLIASMYVASQPGRDTRGLGLPASPLASPSASSVVPRGLTGPEGVVVFAGNREGGFDIWAVRPDGTGLVRITEDPAQERSPSVSADGSRIVFAVGREPDREIHVVNADGTGHTRLTRDPADDFAPAISPDGRMIAWTSTRAGRWKGVWLMTDDGDGFDEDRAVEISDQPSAAGNDSSEPAWFPDSLRVAFQSNDAESTDIWSVDANDDSRRRAWTKDRLGDYQPAVGPDGSIVFVRALARGRFLHRVTPDDPVPRLVTDAVRSPTTPRFSPEGDRLVVARARGDLLTMSLAGTGLRRVPIDDMPTATDPDWVASLAIP